MFNQTKEKNPQVATQRGQRSPEAGSSINLIGSGTMIEGEIKSDGDIRIDGKLVGSVHSKSKVVIGSTGVVEGDVHCQNADISGSIKGKTNVKEMLHLKSDARLNGDIIAGKLVVEVGASFTGTCNMGPLIKDIKHGGETKEQPTQQGQIKEKSA